MSIIVQSKEQIVIWRSIKKNYYCFKMEHINQCRQQVAHRKVPRLNQG